MKEVVKFDEYYLVERVAVGGMAEVFKGISYGEEGFERVSAVKRVLPHLTEDKEFIEMFVDEAKIAAQLQHPNIGQVYHLGQSDGKYFIAMEFISGQDLRIIFDRARSQSIELSIGLCVYLVSEICEALDYAHRKTNEKQEPMHLVHRDISPQNLVLGYDGSVKLIDFGIAKAEGKHNQTQSGILKGKFSYMSPEQAYGHKIDARSDLFALAIVLYELLTLERCFLGQSDFSTIERIRQVEFTPPRKIRRSIPVALERIMQKGLHKDVNQRYQSAADFQEALKRFSRQHKISMDKTQAREFICTLFRTEIQREQNRLQEFRSYAHEYIPQAQRAAGYKQKAKFSQNEVMTGSFPKIKPRFARADEPKLSLDPHIKVTHQTPRFIASKPKSKISPTGKLIILALLGLLAAVITATFTWVKLPSLGGVRILTSSLEPLDYIIQGPHFKQQGKTPLWLQKVPQGNYRIQLSSPLYKTYTGKFTVKEQELTNFPIRLEKHQNISSLKIMSQPNQVNVILNNISVGKTPLTLPQEVGYYQLKVEKEGYISETRNINLDKQGEVVNFILYPEYIHLNIQTNIDYAKISVKSPNRPWIKIDSNSNDTKIRNEDRYEIKVEADGYSTRIIRGLKSRETHNSIWVTLSPKNLSANYQSLKKILNIPSDRNVSTQYVAQKESTSTSVEKNVKPSPKKKKKKKKKKKTYQYKKRSPTPIKQREVKNKQPGLLKLITNPRAEVFIGSKRIGWTPLLNYKLPEGQHVLSLRLGTGEEYKITQEISAGRVTFRRWTKP